MSDLTKWMKLQEDINKETVAQFDKLEQAVAELQREQHAHDDYSGCITKPVYVYPIQPAEKDKCKSCTNPKKNKNHDCSTQRK